IYNSTNNSGNLNLVHQKSLAQTARYPKTNTDNTQDILYSSEDGQITFDYFFNRVKNQNNNIPQWRKDVNDIQKTVNPQAVSFKGKPLLERMRGETFLVRFTQDSETRYGMMLKTLKSDEIIYE